MFVSNNRQRDHGPELELEQEQSAALGWLQRQLAWERVLDGLRRAAGVAPLSAGAERGAAAPAGVPAASHDRRPAA